MKAPRSAMMRFYWIHASKTKKFGFHISYDQMNSQAKCLRFDPHINPSFPRKEFWIYSDQLSTMNEWMMHMNEAEMYTDDSQVEDWMTIWKDKANFLGYNTVLCTHILYFIMQRMNEWVWLELLYFFLSLTLSNSQQVT